MRRKSRVRCFYLSQVRFQSRCWRRTGRRPRRATTPTPDTSSVQRIWIKGFFGFFVMHQLYSTLLHLPPLRFHCVGGCWDRTQDSAISALAVRCSSHWAYILSTLGYISSTLGDISSKLGYISSSLAYISSTLGDISSTLGDISSTLGYISSTLRIHAKHKLTPYAIYGAGCSRIWQLRSQWSTKWSVKNLKSISIFTNHSGILTTRNDQI